MNSNHNDNMQKMIDGYLNGSLSLEQKAVFEKQINTDQALKEELLIYKALQESFNENDWHTLDKNSNIEDFKSIKNRFKTKEYQDISKNIKSVESLYCNKNKKKSNSIFYKLGIAATIILFLAIGLPFIFNTNSLNDYYNDYQNWDTIPSLIEKGSQNESQKIEELYTSKDYNSLIKLYEANNTNNYNNYSLIKIGHIYIELGFTEKAIEVFDKLIATKKLSSSKGYWYKLLVYLKIEDKEKAIEQLNIILQDKNNYKYEEAKELSNKIK
ncbi:hypothetical protein [uncultured Lacinutrix sp.]|uniref:hypothetical protein n=1 Tax=uncultured Lacinutrix sp. TaxID=574032 RepID=UPI00262AC1DF|nr:hypothetical protein [uncultured Lacinutrix sp.]